MTLILSHGTFAQFTADAGRDTILCTPYATVVLGGNPAFSGGQPLYSFSWTCRYFSNGYWHTETFFLADPSSPNPALKEILNEPVNGTISFILKVTDSDQVSVTDTVKITISSISYITTRSLEAHINPGDSVKIEPANIVNGIPPFIYRWEPSAGLSDPTIREPYAKPVVTTYYMVTVIDSTGCENIEYYAVFVNPTFVEKITASYTSLVWPNPVTGNSRISLKTLVSDSLTIEVFDFYGRPVLSDNFHQDYRIGEKISKSGIFFYHIISKNRKVASGKIIKDQNFLLHWR